jgi:hypothetical protein
MNTFLRFNYSARITMLVYELAASLYVLCRIYYYIAIKNHLVYWRRQDLTCWFHESKRSLTSRIVGERLFSDDALIFEVDVWRTRKPCKTSIKSYSRNLYHSSQEWYIYSVTLKPIPPRWLSDIKNQLPTSACYTSPGDPSSEKSKFVYVISVLHSLIKLPIILNY